jgi:hypothetical protein
MRTIYSHGTEFHSCAMCDKELTFDEPGQRVTYDQNGKRIIEHICKECFAEEDYQELIKHISFQHGIFIRLFPQIQD